MLDYAKMILKKVCFDKHIFERELRKFIRHLLPHEIAELKKWCYREFHKVHAPVLDRCFVAV
jgi:hypothetical protein